MRSAHCTLITCRYVYFPYRSGSCRPGGARLPRGFGALRPPRPCRACARHKSTTLCQGVKKRVPRSRRVLAHAVTPDAAPLQASRHSTEPDSGREATCGLLGAGARGGIAGLATAGRGGHLAPRPRAHLGWLAFPRGWAGQQDKIQTPGFSFLFFSIFSSAERKKKKSESSVSDTPPPLMGLCAGGHSAQVDVGSGGRLPRPGRAAGVSTSRRGPVGAGVAGGHTGRGPVRGAEGGASSFEAGSGAGVGRGGASSAAPSATAKPENPAPV